MPHFPSLPDDATTRHVFQRNPERFQGFTEFSQHVLRGASPLSAGMRELLGAYVSALNNCQYCAGGHLATAKIFGVNPDLLAALLEDVTAADIEVKFKPLFHFAHKLTLAPYKLVQADADAVFAAGWNEQALEDAILVCCNFNFMNRLVQGFGIRADPNKFEARARLHAEHGYVDQWQLKQSQ